MHRWFDAIENTVEACLSGDVGVGASSLAEQLVVYGDLGRTYREPTEEWIARLPELHLELSIDWAAVAICRSVEGLAAAVAPLPGFLPEALVVDG